MSKVKEFVSSLSETTTVTKRELFFAALACVFGGIVFGMFCSPKKRTMIGSHNGNHNGNNTGWDDEIWEDDDWEDDDWKEEFPEEELSFK